MIVALVIGKHRSMGCPGKNVRPLLGRPMVEYSFMAARASRHVQRIFTSTDSPEIAAIGRRYGAEHIPRPPHLATPDALTEHALEHAFKEMQRRTGTPIEIIALFFANAPTIPPGMVDQAVDALRAEPGLDSAFSVCKYNMWSPLRARRVDGTGRIQPFVDLGLLAEPDQQSSIRGSGGDCYFVDLAVQVLRARCLEDAMAGQPPFRWMGSNSLAMENDFGFDIDFEWQIPVAEYWLRSRGFSETETPYAAVPADAAT